MTSPSSIDFVRGGLGEAAEVPSSSTSNANRKRVMSTSTQASRHSRSSHGQSLPNSPPFGASAMGTYPSNWMLNDGNGHHPLNSGRRLSKDITPVHRDSVAGSLAGSSSAAASTTGRSSKRDRRNVVTTPAWARIGEGTASAPQGSQLSLPLSSTSAQGPDGTASSTPRRSSQVSPQLRAADATNGTSSPLARSISHSIAAPGSIMEVPEGEDDLDEGGSPGRFWTFTLPTKYRNRLHEHHIRLIRREMAEKTNSKRTRERPSGSSDGDNLQGLSGADPPAAEGSYPLQRTDTRGNDDGWGKLFHSIGTAEGLAGEDSFLSWRKRQQLQTPGSEHVRMPEIKDKDVAKSTGTSDRPTTPQRIDTSPDKSTEQNHATTKEMDLGDFRHLLRAPKQHQSYDGVGAGEYLPSTEMRARLPGASREDNSFTRHQAATPGWASPWRPESLNGAAGFQIGNYTFAPGADGHDFFFRSGTGRSRGKRSKQTKREPDGTKIVSTGQDMTWLEEKWEWWKDFLMRNPFVPLLLRFINFCFTTATLAVAAQLFRILQDQGHWDVVGSSPLLAFLIAPLSLAHVAIQVWLEYFSRPMGLWAVRNKLSYQLIELVFISLWSAELALTFDNYATSGLGCVQWYSVYGSSSCTAESIGADAAVKTRVCDLQAAFIGLSFTTLVAYVAAFVVSLFRAVKM